MDVRYFGFSLFTESKALSLLDFFQDIEREQYVAHKSNENEVRLYIDTKSDDLFYKGLVVTVKNQKRFCKFSGQNTIPKISVENLKGDDKLLDFNFFVVDKATGLGIYQHYHQSCAVNVFGQNLKGYYRKIRNAKIESDLAVAESLKGSKLEEKEKKLIRQKYTERLIFAPLHKKEDIEDLLASCNSINSFEYEYSHLTKEVRDATPLSRFVERKVEKIVFTRESSVVEKAKGIGTFIKNFNPKRGRVFVEDSEGQVLPLKIFEMPDCFGVVNYDSLVLKLDGLEIDRFSEHSFFNELTNIYGKDEYEHIFAMEIS
jgi:hypothetical protein